MLFFGFRSRHLTETARRLYAVIVAQARDEAFYERLGVPDTPDGRYDLIALHAVLVLRRMRGDPAVPAPLSQALFDLMFADMDENLREMGVGDLAVGKRIKAMVQGFYGRLNAYDTAIVTDDRSDLMAALKRNLYRKVVPDDDSVAAVADYVLDQAATLAREDGARIASGELHFTPVSSPDIDARETLET
jgi:cytochrome b pre-mRNA-processing protein 3